MQASKTKAVLAPTVANKTPPTSGPTMLAKVPKPASSALADGSSSGSSRRAGQVSSAGRLNVYRPADRKAKTYSGHSSGVLREALSAISSDIPASATLVTITSRRRSIASAAAPPTIGNTNTGTS